MKQGLTDTFVFDVRGTIVPDDIFSGLWKAFWKFGDRYISREELEGLRQLSQSGKKEETYREYLVKSGEVMVQMLKEGLYAISFYPDVRPAFEEIKKWGLALRIFSTGIPDLTKELCKQGSLSGLISGVSSSTTGLSIADKTDPRCYLVLEEEVMIPTGEAFRAYVSDDVNETNACRTAFPIAKMDVFYIDRGQYGKKNLAKGVKPIKDLRDVL